MSKTFAIYIDTITARLCSKGDVFAICNTDDTQFNTKIIKIIRDEKEKNRTILFVEPIGEISLKLWGLQHDKARRWNRQLH